MRLKHSKGAANVANRHFRWHPGQSIIRKTIMVHPDVPYAKVALLTGAFSGIGLASSVRLAQAGWTVYGAGRNLAKGENLVSQAQAQGTSVRLLKLDVTDEGSIAEAIGHIEHDAGRLDLLVNNAGFGLSGAVTE